MEVGQSEAVIRQANVEDAEIASRLSVLCDSKYREDACAWAKAVNSGNSGRSHYVAEIKPHTGSDDPIVAGYGRFALDHEGSQESPKYRVYLGVHPESRRQGIGSALLEHILEELRRFGASAVRTRVQSDHTETVAFFRRREFAAYDHKVVLELNLATLEEAAIDQSVREHVERLATFGVTIRCLADWSKEDPDYLGKLLPVYNALGKDVPQPDPYKPVTTDELLRFLSGPGLSPEGFLVATHKDDVVGFSYLLTSAIYSRRKRLSDTALLSTDQCPLLQFPSG